MAKNNLLKRSINYKGLKQDLKKEVQKYMKLPYTIKLIQEEDGTYYVSVDELPGCASMGDTVEEAIDMIKEAMEVWLESSIDRGLEIPLPDVMREYSGRFLVRVPVSLHRRLAEIAKKEGVSLNHYIVSALSEKLSTKDIENELKIIKDKVDLLIATQNNQSRKISEKNIPVVKKFELKWEEEHGRNKQYIQ